MILKIIQLKFFTFAFSNPYQPSNMNDKIITIKDIALKAKVSAGTVDSVLHKRGKVAPKVEEKILRIIKEMEYEPNIIARALSSNGQNAGVNFYKCGDDLPKPHYLCWNPIKSETPDFHLPEFFGNAIFE